MLIDTKIAQACDQGLIEFYEIDLFDHLTETLVNKNNLNKHGGTKMKIAIASEKEMVTEHFGHCESFIVFETEHNTIIKKETIPNPGHKPGFLPNFLNDIGVNVIISGGMGGGAIEIFNEKGIEVITGASGSAETVAKDYLKGSLKSTGSVCHEHQHHGEC